MTACSYKIENYIVFSLLINKPPIARAVNVTKNRHLPCLAITPVSFGENMSTTLKDDAIIWACVPPIACNFSNKQSSFSYCVILDLLNRDISKLHTHQHISESPSHCKLWVVGRCKSIDKYIDSPC